MMKRIIAAVLLCLVLTGCASNQISDLKLFDYVPAQLTNKTTDTLDKDADMTIDGLKNEGVYKNPLSFVEPSSGITVTAYAHMGEKGLYLYIETDDKNIYISEEKNFWENDSVEFYLDPNPAYSISAEGLNQQKVRRDCLHLRVNALGQYQTWYGRTMASDASRYPFVLGCLETEIAGKVNGQINKAGGATGYSVEIYIPWAEFELEGKPENVGVMPAFNNVDNREDTSRTWFSVKGMGIGSPTSWALVDENGFADVGYAQAPAKELSANKADPYYADARQLLMQEVDKNNRDPMERATLKTRLGEDAVYFLLTVKDRVWSHNSDSIWGNDGIELVIDTSVSYVDNIYREGIYRIGVDVDGGVETDICVSGHSDYVPSRRAVFTNISVSELENDADGYRYEYVYEIAVPYSSLDLEGKPEALTYAWAVKSPNEVVYILDRQSHDGVQEGQDWLWMDKHYPLNPGEYFLVGKAPALKDHIGDDLPDLNEYKTVQTEAPDRYQIYAVAKDNGLAVQMTQYIDHLVMPGNGADKWNDATHVEFEVWNGDMGYGWGGTYFAIFTNGDYYINNWNNVSDIKVSVDFIDHGPDYTEGTRYEVTYKMFIEFPNNVNSADGPYAYVKFYSFTPGETDYPATVVTYRENRLVYSDACNSYEIHADGISRKMYS